MSTFEGCKKCSDEPKFLPGDIVVIDEFYIEYGFKNLVGVIINSEIIKEEGDESGSYPPFEFWEYTVLMDIGIINFDETSLVKLEDETRL